MFSHPDADAFMRSYLARPTDATARLVFADWLDETGEPHNAAWARFIRLRIEADHFPPESAERRERDRVADASATHIRANLTVPAALFVRYPKSLLQLLPAPNITVKLADFEAPRDVVEYMPESVTRENVLMILAMQERVHLIAAACPDDTDLARKLEFILNRDIVLVGAGRDDVLRSLDRHYGEWNVETVDSFTPLLVDTDSEWVFASTGPPPVPAPDSEPVVRLVNLILQEAINLRADGIRIVPEPDSLTCSYHTDSGWAERDRLPLRLLGPITARLALMAWLHVETVLAEPPVAPRHTGNVVLHVHGIRFNVAVTIAHAPEGPSIHLELRRDPVTVADQ